MKFKISILLFVVFFLSLGCHDSKKKENKYLNKGTEEWNRYLNKLEIQKKDLNRQVFLVMQAIECSPCLKELNWWDDKAQKIPNLEVDIIIIEKYGSTIDTYITTNKIGTPVHQDSAGRIFDYDLIPFTPIKVFFDNNSRLAAMDKMGTGGDLKKFVKIITTRD